MPCNWRALGPQDPLRSASPAELMGAALAAADRAGVTRLADITRLDRIGLPVWQAVRPGSRALSVHQGKGATHADARLGALLEAVESHAAERFGRVGPSCSFEALPTAARAPTIADFAADRALPPSRRRRLDWVEGEPLPGGTAVFVPHAIVSLDLTRRTPRFFDRASNGVATAATRSEAIFTALHELIERDAVVEWQNRDMVERMESTIIPATIPFPWFAALSDRIARAGASVTCYSVPSITRTPVIACAISDSGKRSLPYRATSGRAAHAIPENALFKAVAEACQSRAAYIAGARDDLLPSLYAAPEQAITVAFALPPPPEIDGVDFGTLQNGPRSLEELSSALVAAGYPHNCSVTLAEPPGLHVVRVFVCGLGSIGRRRREPIH